MAKILNLNSRDLYSDGAESELLKIIQDAKDISSSSDELQAHIHDWPTEYHLSRQRLNLLLPLEISPGMKILDVGGGTGVLTRYLAEQGAQVTMLEGELERSLVALERCRDLDNVEIVVGEVDDLDSRTEYDLILVVGVLEYIGKENSLSWLKSLSSLLKRDGTLALAIENKIGLKYLLGYPEDHTGNFWDGILDYRGSDRPRTYSKKELADLLSSAGLISQDWWYPFPDYKMPTSVIAEQGLTSLNPSEISSLIRQGFRGAGHDTLIDFDPKDPIKVAASAGLLGELANSFFVLSQTKVRESDTSAKKPLLASGDFNYRKKRYRRSRSLYQLENKKFFLNRYMEMIDPAEKNDEAVIHHNLESSEDYVNGESLLDKLYAPHVNAEDVIKSLILVQQEVLKDNNFSKFDLKENPYLPNAECKSRATWNMDINMGNFIINEKSLINIDREWINHNGACMELVLLRSIFYLLIDQPSLRGLFDKNNEKDLWNIMLEVSSNADAEKIHTHMREEFITAEQWFISNVSVFDQGDSIRNALLSKTTKKPASNLPFNHYAFEQMIVNFAPVRNLQEENHRIQEENHRIQEENHRIQKENNQLVSSRSWRLTRPLRGIKKVFSKK